MLMTISFFCLMLISTYKLLQGAVHVVSFMDEEHSLSDVQLLLSSLHTLAAAKSSNSAAKAFHHCYICNFTHVTQPQQAEIAVYDAVQPISSDDVDAYVLSIPYSHAISAAEKSIQCILAVSRYLFQQMHYHDHVLFISSKYIVTSNQLLAEMHKPATIQHDFLCVPSTSKGACALNIHAIRVATAYQVLFAMHSRLDRQVMTIEDAFYVALVQQVQAIYFLHLPIVYAYELYIPSYPPIPPALIEFDGIQHKLQIDRAKCKMKIHIATADYNTLPAIQQLSTRLEQSNDIYQRFVGCANTSNSMQSALSTTPDYTQDLYAFRAQTTDSKGRIFNCMLFEGSIELLTTYFSHSAASSIDTTIIIEPTLYLNGSGKRQPVYRQHANRLASYAASIVYISLEHLPHASASALASRANKQHAWNMCLHGLHRIGVKPSDMLLLTEATELLDKAALDDIRHWRRYADSISSYASLHKKSNSDYGGVKKLPAKYCYHAQSACMMLCQPYDSMGVDRVEVSVDVPTMLTLASCDAGLFSIPVKHLDGQHLDGQEEVTVEQLLRRYDSCLGQARYYPAQGAGDGDGMVPIGIKGQLSMMWMPASGYRILEHANRVEHADAMVIEANSIGNMRESKEDGKCLDPRSLSEKDWRVLSWIILTYRMHMVT